MNFFPPIHKNKDPMKKRIETKEKGEMLLTESLMIGNVNPHAAVTKTNARVANFFLFIKIGTD